MKKDKAYSILGLSSSASEDEVKKRYRDLSKKYHPDVYKEADADVKFKEINEAYTRIKNNDFEQEMPQGFGDFSGFGGFAGINLEDLVNFGFRDSSVPRNRNIAPIEIPIIISFKESVFGCKKDISFSRKIKCNSCNGNGSKNLNNGCKTCNGMGRTFNKRGNMLITSTCNSCYGKVNKESCKTCSSSGCLESNTSLSINIPPGIENNNTLRLVGMGNFIVSNNFGDKYSDVYAHVQVVQDPNFKLEDGDVISSISLSLLEALEGTKKNIITLDGDKEVEIKPLSKNKDELVIPNLGVAREGNQRVILNIEYPSDIKKLTECLKETL